ncbi:STAS domain-containing protein [Quadrisphaera sp. DSM 44207]|uniref:STAS domain-containing protein n=1 Tax=Quadrisphaera sp. DSM 44207 TaxID=1881057 RepID=UPI0008907B6C|nr:STAS domain-containing protein [Quadrisphaera sp. DSM 44207]SDQ73721.1 anti-anti-sigma factor [Quadrisphaera sp. DSM 44207]
MDVLPLVPGQLLRLRGRLSLRAVASAREAVHEAIGAGTGVLVLDLSCVPACDTAGLAMLLTAHRIAERRGRRLELAGVGSAVARALLRSRLHRVLHLQSVPRGAPLPR